VTELGLLQRCHLDVADAYRDLFLNRDLAGSLKKDEQELLLVGAYAVYGGEEDVAEHGRRALDAGAAPAAILEIVLAATISRGRKALKMALPFLSDLAITEAQADQVVPGLGEPPLEYFRSQFGGIPDWVDQLHGFSPGSLAGYAVLRSQILADGATSRKTKELLTMLLNAVAGNESGIRSHANAALRFGADGEEILGVLLLGIRVGGIVVWINGVNSLSGMI
jgi:alkylhydroperoxidase/carboxymuconolactone decarboxylase family protein YurZ